jgi:hypothetical protein
MAASEVLVGRQASLASQHAVHRYSLGRRLRGETGKKHPSAFGTCSAHVGAPAPALVVALLDGCGESATMWMVGRDVSEAGRASPQSASHGQ